MTTSSSEGGGPDGPLTGRSMGVGARTGRGGEGEGPKGALPCPGRQQQLQLLGPLRQPPPMGEAMLMHLLMSTASTAPCCSNGSRYHLLPLHCCCTVLLGDGLLHTSKAAASRGNFVRSPLGVVITITRGNKTSPRIKHRRGNSGDGGGHQKLTAR